MIEPVPNPSRAEKIAHELQDVRERLRWVERMVASQEGATTELDQAFWRLHDSVKRWIEANRGVVPAAALEDLEGLLEPDDGE